MNAIAKIGEVCYYLNFNKLTIKIYNQYYFKEFIDDYDEDLKILTENLLKIIKLSIDNGTIECKYNGYLKNIEIKIENMIIPIEKYKKI